MLESIILGLVQGVAEWLPISSEGIISLIMVNMGNTLKDSVMYAIWLHLGTLFSALVYFRKDIKYVVSDHRFRQGSTFWFLFLATIFSVIVGFPIVIFGLDKIDISMASVVIGMMLVFTGLVQYMVHRFGTNTNTNLKDSVLLGLLQGLAAMPGISRSGITVSGFLFRGYKPETAFRLSFLMSIPVVMLSSLYIIVTSSVVFSLETFVALFVAFVSGLITIRILLRFAKNFNFSTICIVLGVLSILASFI